jgi:hypothetical protein
MRFVEGMDAIPKSGGSHTPRATERKDAGAERLAGLVAGDMRRMGIDVVDGLKAGCLAPEARMDAIRRGILQLDRFLARLYVWACVPGERRPLVRQGIEEQRAELEAAFLAIASDMPQVLAAREDRRNSRCRKCDRLFEATSASTLVCRCREPQAAKGALAPGKAPPAGPKPPRTPEGRCSKCNRLADPPKGCFGCCC